MSLIFLDTETTGIDPARGHRIVEVAALKVAQRRLGPENEEFHSLLNPEREIDAQAESIHGWSRERLAREPRFAQIAASLADFLRGGEIVIHNAAFDVAFLDSEFDRAGLPSLAALETKIVCSLELSRRKLATLRQHSLDALCSHFGIDRSARAKGHSALLDVRLLAQMFLALTCSQGALEIKAVAAVADARRDLSDRRLRALVAAPADAAAHEALLDKMTARAGIDPIWRRAATD